MHTAILLIFLVIANFVGNEVVKGVLLLMFAAVLIVNNILKLKTKMNDKIGGQIFYWVLLILDIILAVCAIVVIVISALGNKL
jgi:hypothetical protein